MNIWRSEVHVKKAFLKETLKAFDVHQTTLFCTFAPEFVYSSILWRSEKKSICHQFVFKSAKYRFWLSIQSIRTYHLKAARLILHFGFIFASRLKLDFLTVFKSLLRHIAKNEWQDWKLIKNTKLFKNLRENQ